MTQREFKKIQSFWCLVALLALALFSMNNHIEWLTNANAL